MSNLFSEQNANAGRNYEAGAITNQNALEIAETILNDIERYAEDTYNSGHRKHLGASLIGHECKRYLWSMFRWLKAENHEGRLLRLFQRGHLEEARFIEYLRGIGCQVFEWDSENNRLWFHPESDSYVVYPTNNPPDDQCLIDVTGDEKHYQIAKAMGTKFPQFHVSSSGGHFGGSLDAKIILPERFGISEPILGEFKTQGTGAGFNKLLQNGMAYEKPQHMAQTSVYGTVKGYSYVLYMAVNKNDDTMHIELVPINKKLGEQMLMKADMIILSQEAPPKISQTETFLTCKMCSFNKICHQNAAPEVNCRSCKNARPVDNKQWFCHVHNAIIPEHIIPVACDQYKAITENA